MDGSHNDIRSLELLLKRLGPGNDPVEQQALREIEQAIAMRRIMQRSGQMDGKKGTN